VQCPRHHVEFEEDKRHGVQALECPECTGVWIEPTALEQLEDRVFPEEMRKGTLKYGSQDSDLSCPHCGKTMVLFRYRANNLELDHCPDDAGYWLDKDEDRRILELMEERASDLKRSVSAQVSWHRAKRGKSRGLLDRIKDVFRG
jgi:Zn-finger nucleic acid-binding protein